MFVGSANASVPDAGLGNVVIDSSLLKLFTERQGTIVNDVVSIQPLVPRYEIMVVPTAMAEI